MPHFVAKEWHAACDKAMNVDGEDVGPVLGSIKIKPPGPGEGSTQFELKLDNEATAELPQEYKMKAVTRTGPAMLAFSENSGRIASEGVVQHRLEVEPTASRGAAGTSGVGIRTGGLSADPAYRKLSRERSEEASRKTRTVQIMSDHKITNIRKPVGAEFVGQKRKAETKRTAMDKEELQSLLFKKFEKQTRWSFPQLQQETEQPTPHLKLVLGEIAIQNKRGPYRDLWELKKEYK